jgi:hypothetical protein
MTTAALYIQETESRLIAAGYKRAEIGLPNNGSTPCFYRSVFRTSWIFSRLHVFVVLVNREDFTYADFEAFTTNSVLELAVKAKGRFRGLQLGVCAIPVLVQDSASPELSAAVAGESLISRFAAFAAPTLIDLSAKSLVHTTINKHTKGRLYLPWLRSQWALMTPGRDHR